VVKRRFVLAAAIVLIVGIVLVLGVVLMPPGTISSLVTGTPSDTTTLRARALDLVEAFSAGRIDRVYRLFNSDFRNELTEAQLEAGIRLWLAGRRVRRMTTTHLEVKGLSGLVSSNVYFDLEPHEPVGPATGRAGARPDTGRAGVEPDSSAVRGPQSAFRRQTSAEQEFLFQYWVRTDEGWQLLWLNRILDPVALDYGHRDTAALQEILQLALEQVIAGAGLERMLGIAVGAAPIVLLSHGASDRTVSLAGRRVLWLTRDEIAAQQPKLRIPFYIDVQPIRVLKHLAIGTFDIVPLRQSADDRRQTRSIKLFFVREREGGKWEFADYGSKW
jgi:hypothetical protein